MKDKFIGRRILFVEAPYSGKVVDRASLNPKLYLVELDVGFYSPDRNTFISLMVIHSKNMKLKDGELPKTLRDKKTRSGVKRLTGPGHARRPISKE